jgi:hypothetical protein
VKLTNTQKKIAWGVGLGAGALGIVWLFTRGGVPSKKTLAPPPRLKGLNFETRNLDALNAVVDAMVADPKLGAAAINRFADQLANYGLFEQELKLRAKIDPLLKVQMGASQAGGTSFPKEPIPLWAEIGG